MTSLLPRFQNRIPESDLTPAEKKFVETKVPQPLKEEPCSMKELKEAIPRELFDFDMATSWYYIATDFAKIAAVSGAAYCLLEYALQPASSNFLAAVLRLAVILLAGFMNGTTCFGIWVIAHECGHQAYFGTNKKLNNAVGLVLHSALLVPYHSWRITHGTHHKYTNNLQRDTAFPPVMETVISAQTYEDIPLLQLIPCIVYPIIGFPAYLSANLAGKWYPNQWANHFNPNAPMFRKSDREDVITSVVAFFTVIAGLVWWSISYGFTHMFQWYGLAWLGCNAWLVVITLLQHQHPDCPHYDDDEFTFLKGACSTVDRDYGKFLGLDLNVWMHHITDFHVCHHVFSTMPFYNAKKATPYLAKMLGKAYHRDERPLYTQFREGFQIHEHSYLVWQRQPAGAELKHLNLKH